MNQAASTRWTGQRTVDCEHSLVHSPLLFCPPSRSEANQFKGWRHPVSTFCFVSAQRKRHIPYSEYSGVGLFSKKEIFSAESCLHKAKEQNRIRYGSFSSFSFFSCKMQARTDRPFQAVTFFFSSFFEEENEKVNPKEIRKSKNSWNN